MSLNEENTVLHFGYSIAYVIVTFIADLYVQ